MQTVLEYDPNNSSAYDNMGLLYLRRKEYDNAEEKFEAALRIDPENAYAQRNLGSVLLRKGDYNRAENHLKKALDIDPFSSIGHYNLGRVYVAKKDYEPAEEAFRSALKIEPNNPNICFALGDVLSRKTNTHLEAIELIKKGLTANPRYFRGHIMLGNLYINSGDIKSAIMEFENALKLNPNAPDLRKKINELKRIID